MTEWEDVTPERPKSPSIKVTSDHIRKANHRDTSDVFNDPVSIALKEHLNADWCMSGWGYAKCGFGNIQRGYTLWPQKILVRFFQNWQNKSHAQEIEFHATLDREIDKTPKQSTRKSPRNKSWLQREAEEKIKAKQIGMEM